MAVGSWWYYVVSLLIPQTLLSHSMVFVAVPDVYAFVGDDAVIECHVQFHLDEPLLTSAIVFWMTGTNLKCQMLYSEECVPMYLPQAQPPRHFTCGCSKLTTQSTGSMFTFFLYLRSVHLEIDKSRFKCYVDPTNIGAEGHLNLIDFSRKPDALIFKCPGESVEFDWDYNPTYFNTRFAIEEISWQHQSVGGNPVLIGGLNKNMSDQLTGQFANRSHLLRVSLTDTIPHLVLDQLRRLDSGVVGINMTFSSTGDLQVVTPAGEDFQMDTITDFGDLENMVRVSQFLEKRRPVLHDSVILNVLKPLKVVPTLEFKLLDKKDGLFLNCCLIPASSATSLGLHRLEIYGGDEVLGSSNESFLMLELDKTNLKENYSCELTSPALNCHTTSPKRIRKYIGQNVYARRLAQSEETFAYSQLGFFEVIFILEETVCVFLLLYTVSLLIHHGYLVMSRLASQEVEKLPTSQNITSSESPTPGEVSLSLMSVSPLGTSSTRSSASPVQATTSTSKGQTTMSTNRNSPATTTISTGEASPALLASITSDRTSVDVDEVESQDI